MKQNVLLLPLIGAGLTIFCFFLPWINIDLSTIKMESPSMQFPSSIESNMPEPKLELEGTLIARGFKLATGDANWSTLSLLAAIAIVGICIYMQSQKTPLKSRLSLLICSGIGLISLLFLILINMQIISFGAYGAAIGFIIALFGAWKIPKSAAQIETSDVAET